MGKNSVSSVASTFILCFLLWLLLTGSLAVSELIAGGIVSLLAALFSARFFIHEEAFYLFRPRRLGAVFVYCFAVFPTELFKANLDVARRALAPGKPRVNPGVVRIPVGLKSDYGVAALANSITLTPGTITLDVGSDEEGQNYFYVHCIDVGALGEDEGESIKGRLEKWLGRIWK